MRAQEAESTSRPVGQMKGITRLRILKAGRKPGCICEESMDDSAENDLGRAFMAHGKGGLPANSPLDKKRTPASLHQLEEDHCSHRSDETAGLVAACNQRNIRVIMDQVEVAGLADHETQRNTDRGEQPKLLTL